MSTANASISQTPAESNEHSALLLISHGTVDSLDQLPEFLRAIRRGHAASAALLAEITRRYQAIGGSSPLTAINQRLAALVRARSGRPVWLAARFGEPALARVLAEIAASAARELIVLPLAQHSSAVYRAAVAEAIAQQGLALPLRAVANWGQRDELIGLQCKKVQDALAQCGPGARVLFTAHSLPQAVIDAGDPYERELRQAAQTIATRLGLGAAQLVFQSEGASEGPAGRKIAWLGPNLLSAMQQAAREGTTELVLAPIGFLADHVEILYDLDIEAKMQAKELNLRIVRSESINDDPALAELLVALANEAT